MLVRYREEAGWEEFQLVAGQECADLRLKQHGGCQPQ